MGSCSLIFICSAAHLQNFRVDSLQLVSLTWFLNSSPESDLRVSTKTLSQKALQDLQEVFFGNQGQQLCLSQLQNCILLVWRWMRECDRILRRGQPVCSVLYLCYVHSQPRGQSCLMTDFAVSNGLKFTDPDTLSTILHNDHFCQFFLNLGAYYNFLFQSTKYYFNQIQLWDVFFLIFLFFSPNDFFNLRADSQRLF